MIDARMTRRAFLGLMATATLAGCGGNTRRNGSAAGVKAIMVTDLGGVYDHSFNELSWSGLNRLSNEFGWDVSYIESRQEADWVANLEKAVDAGAGLVWGIGYTMADAINEVAGRNPDVKFGAIECDNLTGAANLTGVSFKSEESSFVVGYIAARMSQTGKVGYVGPIESEVNQAFLNGYFAGVEYANREQGTSVTYQSQMAEYFDDPAKGKSIAGKMIEDGVDVIYQTAGQTGFGVIDACDEAGVFAIGVDMDQSYLAPNTVITSALKHVDEAIYQVSKQLVMDGSGGGQNLVLGVAEHGVGIAETHDLIPDDVFEAALGVLGLLGAGDISVPATAAGLADYIGSL